MIERMSFRDTVHGKQFTVTLNDKDYEIELRDETGRLVATASPNDVFDTEGNRFDLS